MADAGCAAACRWRRFPADKPNILVIWGDDIGTWNISHNSRGMMGYKTPNIDRIANEGVAFTDYYGQQSAPSRTRRVHRWFGAGTYRDDQVGLPGAKEGWQKTDIDRWPRCSRHRATPPQFGSWIIRATATSTCRPSRFRRFFGNLYHLNAEEERRTRTIRSNPEFHKKFGPRGVLQGVGDGDGQKIEDTGPLTKEPHGNGGR